MIRFCDLIEVYRAINDFEQRFFKENNLCVNEAMILCLLNKETTLSSGEVVEKLSLPAPHISKLVKSLEDKDLVIRSIGEKDKRNMLFSLSEAGLRKVNQISPFGDQLAFLLSNSIIK